MVRLTTSPSAEDRLQLAETSLREWSAHPEVVVVTPNRGAGDDLARRVARPGVWRHTLLQLALQMSTPLLSSRELAPISGVALRATLVRAIHKARRRPTLRYLDGVADTVGFPRALERTLRELRMEEIDPAGLDDAAPDLGSLLRAYEDELAVTGLADAAKIFATAHEALRTDTPTLPPLLLLDVPVRTRLETRFLAALARACSETVAITLPQAGRSLRNLEVALGTRAQPIEGPGANETALARVRIRVFALETTSGVVPDETLIFFSATDEGRECAEIARRVQQAASAGTRFDDMCVLLRNPGLYQPLLEDALARAGVPVWFTRGVQRPNASGRAFLCLLACRSESYSATRFAEYVSLGQVPPDPAPDEEVGLAWVPAQGELFDAPLATHTPPTRGVRAPDRWERLLVDASLVGGKQRWSTRLEGLRQEILTRLGETGLENDGLHAYLLRQLSDLEALAAFALPLIEALAALPEAASWEQWLRHLEPLALEALSHPEPVLSVLAELRPLGELSPVSLHDVEQVLAERLTTLRVEMTGRRYGKVFVSTVAEAAGRSFSLVCLPGLAEGVFPRKTMEDPLLPDASRPGLGDGLPVNADRVREERLGLHIALGSARDRIIVSYPRTDVAQGRAHVPSFYALDILRALEGEIPDLGQLERRAVASSRSRVGWPSPIEAREAIDDAEYDLATIGALLHQAPEAVAGRARYLIEAHPTLARSLRTRARRWKNFWSLADGLVDPDSETLRILAAHRPADRAYSATSVEQYAACPYRFLLQAILRLSPRDEIVRIERIDPLTRGRLFHTVQFRLLSGLKAAGLLPIRDANVARITRDADRILDEAAGEFHEALAPAIETVWRTGIESLRTDLRVWLLSVAEGNRVDPGWVPFRFEFAFGLKDPGPEVDSESSPREAVLPGRLRLRGAIDLIEEHAGTGLLRVTDHKTGRAPGESPLTTGRGEVLQPLLYACAVEYLLGRKVALSRLAYCTERGGFRNIDIPVDEASAPRLESIVAAIDSAVVNGFLPAAPREGACTYCDYRPVCGPYEELRASRKQAARLEPLTRIRSVP